MIERSEGQEDSRNINHQFLQPLLTPVPDPDIGVCSVKSGVKWANIRYKQLLSKKNWRNQVPTFRCKQLLNIKNWTQLNYL